MRLDPPPGTPTPIRLDPDVCDPSPPGVSRRGLLKASAVGALFVPLAAACSPAEQSNGTTVATGGEITASNPPNGTRLTLLGTSGGPPPDYGRTGISSVLTVDG